MSPHPPDNTSAQAGGDDVPTRKRGASFLRVLCALFVCATLLLFAPALASSLFELPLHLTAGWYWFLQRWSEAGQIVWADVGLAAAFLVIVTVGVERFVEWLTKGTHRDGSQEGPPADPEASSHGKPGKPVVPVSCKPKSSGWCWRITLRGVALVLLFLLSGTSLLGMAHQCLWMASSNAQFSENTTHELTGPITTRSRLKNIGKAFNEYHDARRSAGKTSDKSVPEGDMPTHSWVTALLPWLGPEAARLDREIHHDLQWNHPENRPVMKTPVRGLQGRYSGRKETDDGYATCHFAGNVHAFEGHRILPLGRFSDGTGHTLLIGETRFRHKAWGDPDNLRDPTLGINQTPADFGSHCHGITHFLMADGSLRLLHDDIDPEVLRALSTPGGGERVPDRSY